MTSDDQWIGNLGHLALADATLGALIIEMLSILAHAAYPDAPAAVNPGATTKQAAKKVLSRLDADPNLFGDGRELGLLTSSRQARCVTSFCTLLR
jgi:hypothetical protein